MIVDARSVPTGFVIETDVCIVGGGAAGISLAREFTNSGFRVTLLESGGFKLEQETQDLYAGDVVGQSYDLFPVSRLRYFGGTTNHWGRVWCDMPHALDFAEREGVNYSGWPFSLDFLKPWFLRAQSVLRLGQYGFGLSDWGLKPSMIPEPFQGPHVSCRLLQQAPATRFGRHYTPEFRRAKNLSVYLHANGLRFDTSENGREAQQLHVGVLPNGRFAVRARVYVLSAGGIENARLLLLSENEAGVGIGNQNDLVGRFFMLHLEYTGGFLELTDPNTDLTFQTGEQGAKHSLRRNRRFVSYITLTEETRRKRKLPNVKWRFQYPRPREMDSLSRLVPLKWSDLKERADHNAEYLNDLELVMKNIPSLARYTTRRILYGRNKPPAPILKSIPLKCTAEQMPNPDSRIELGDKLDVFGLPKVLVKWQLTAEDRRGISVGNQLLSDELERSGFGKLKSTVPEGDNQWPFDLRGDQHHMGTTRMHRDPRMGVVDENCQVHGVSNVYVAGSSVFPTGGTFNPTLTIIALALRLADHIKNCLR